MVGLLVICNLQSAIRNPQLKPRLTSIYSAGIIVSLYKLRQLLMLESTYQVRGDMAQESLALTATLNQLAKLDRYNHWIYESISQALGRRVLEVGSGTGNITRFLCSGGREVTATDVVPSYRNELERLFGGNPKVRVEKFDLTTEAPDTFVADPFDSVVCLNVLEHIEDDLFALAQMRDSLAPGGKLALLAPGHRVLYGEFGCSSSNV